MEISTSGQNTICLPFPSETDYRHVIAKGSTFRSYLDQLIKTYPELFPAAISSGY